MAFLYLDAHSADFARLMADAQPAAHTRLYAFPYEEEFIVRLKRFVSGAAAWRETRAFLDRLIVAPTAPTRDERVRAAFVRLRADRAARPTLAALAAEAGLSPARFSQLFKASTGVPLRRYRIWTAMRAAIDAMGRGGTLTSAALDAGFASSAHFSAAFREMFGMEPSRLAGAVRAAR
jgi:AraC-like DNA-binding protein